MKQKFFSAAIALLLSTGFAMAQLPRYTTVPGDPMKTRIYTLSNGLKVYLSVNKEKPRVQTYIAVTRVLATTLPKQQALHTTSNTSCSKAQTILEHQTFRLKNHCSIQ